MIYTLVLLTSRQGITKSSRLVQMAEPKGPGFSGFRGESLPLGLLKVTLVPLRTTLPSLKLT